MQIVVRIFDPVIDSGLIYSSYAKAVYYGRLDKPDKKQWFKDFHEKVKEQLKHATIYIACDYNNTDFTFGYAISIGNELQFVYVKPLYRRKGIAKLLVSNKIETINPDYLTKIGQSILNKEQNEKQ